MLSLQPALGRKIKFDEIYDLEADPYEMTNLASDPGYADVLPEMASRMWSRIRETDDLNMVHSHYGMFRHAPVGHAFA